MDYARLVEHYEPTEDEEGQLQGTREYFKGSAKEPVTEKPRLDRVSTSNVERQNLTMRMSMRRFTRGTNAFSKRVENHTHAVALHFAYYNFCRIHRTIRITPAMAAGVPPKLWEIRDLVELVEASLPKLGPRGPYRTGNSN